MKQTHGLEKEKLKEDSVQERDREERERELNGKGFGVSVRTRKGFCVVLQTCCDMFFSFSFLWYIEIRIVYNSCLIVYLCGGPFPFLLPFFFV